MIEIKVQKTLFGSSGEFLLDVDIMIERGEFIALLGESGGGKTTIMRILAGLEKANGIIKVDDEIWQDESTFLPPQKRGIGFVFQDYALFNNLTVEENLLFVQNDTNLANHLLEVTNLTNLKSSYPMKLSGGQKQRVALCRALMKKPKILLMDEPLSAIDPLLRVKLQDEILSLHKEFNTTSILVSHDISEIKKMSDRILVLKDGKISTDNISFL